MLSYLVLMHDPEPPPFIGLEEPENFLHPRLLDGLAAAWAAWAQSNGVCALAAGGPSGFGPAL